jgi:hypothetical protein
MLKVTLSGSDPTILVFDGEILECFFIDGSKRFHITHIKGIQFEPDNKGKYMLTIKLTRDPIFLWVDEAAAAKVKELIAELQKAMASFKV